MRLRVLCFGRLRELLAPEVTVELGSAATVADLWKLLLLQHAVLAPYERSVAIAVNQAFALPSTRLAPGDEVALLPPVSGGLPAPAEEDLPLATAHARLQREAILAEPVMSSLQLPEDGALVVFEGVVRNHSRGRRTLYLEYEAYPRMAVAEMERLAAEALSRFAVRDVRLVHRVGRLEISETSVLIVVASAHRAAAFDACRWLIDTLKQKVPIWKREFFEDGAVWADGEPFPPECRG